VTTRELRTISIGLPVKVKGIRGKLAHLNGQTGVIQERLPEGYIVKLGDAKQLNFRMKNLIPT
jgi:hypothetical protein